MNGPKVFGILVVLIVGLLVVERLILSWSKNEALGISSAGAPFNGAQPQAGAPGISTSTLTHGHQVDAALPRPAAPVDAAAREAQFRAQAEFASFLEATMRRLPTADDAKKLTAKEAHGHPKVVTAAAAELGALAEKLERDPSLRPQGLGFYQGCAQNVQVFRSVRALCFNRAQLLHMELHQDIWNYDPTRIPKDIIELAKTF